METISPKKKKATKKIMNELHARKSKWASLDKFLEEEDPAPYDKLFSGMKTAMMSQIKYLGSVVKYIRKSRETDNIKDLFQQFCQNATDAQFVNGEQSSDQLGISTIFGVLSELFTAIPKYKTERGSLRRFLIDKLLELLDSRINWPTIFFSTEKFRAIFWQLVNALGLERVEKKEEHRAELMYCCLVLAILVLIARNHDLVFNMIPGFKDAKDVVEMFTCMASSAIFRNMCFFFFSSHWLIQRIREENGYITASFARPVPQSQDRIDDQDFERRAARDFNVYRAVAYGVGGREKIEREWEMFSLGQLMKGFLAATIVQEVKKVGRPPKKTKRTHAGVAIQPAPVAPPAPAPAEKVEKIVEPIPNPHDVGLAKPLNILMRETIAEMKAEMVKRRDPNYVPMDINKFYLNAYRGFNKVQKAQEKSAGVKLNKEQKLVQDRFQEIYANPDDAKMKEELDALYATPETRKEPKQKPEEDVKEESEDTDN